MLIQAENMNGQMNLFLRDLLEFENLYNYCEALQNHRCLYQPQKVFISLINNDTHIDYGDDCENSLQDLIERLKVLSDESCLLLRDGFEFVIQGNDVLVILIREKEEADR